MQCGVVVKLSTRPCSPTSVASHGYRKTSRQSTDGTLKLIRLHFQRESVLTPRKTAWISFCTAFMSIYRAPTCLYLPHRFCSTCSETGTNSKLNSSKIVIDMEAGVQDIMDANFFIKSELHIEHQQLAEMANLRSACAVVRYGGEMFISGIRLSSSA